MNAASKSAKPAAKQATKPAPAVKATAKAPASTKKPATPAKPAVTTKAIAKKVPAAKAVTKESNPVVRDSFTMTAADHELLKTCKRDAIAAGRDSTKKSEIVRAALKHFAQLPAATRLSELNNLWPIKTGRPNKKK